MTTPKWLLALDFGGTKLSAAVAARGSRKWDDYQRTESGANAHDNLETMLNLAREVLKGRDPTAVGVSFGGPVNVRTGHVIRSFQVPGWDDFPLQDKLQSEFRVPTSMDNDGNAAALGESHFGAGQKCESMLYVTVSTGVGGGWVLGSRIYRGANNMAGEIGHVIVEPGGPRCGCGQYGCVEAIASGPSLARYARERLTAEPLIGKTLRELVDGNLSAITAEHLAHAAEAGDKFSTEILNRSANALGKGIGAAIMLMNPERVVLGGGVTKSGKHYWETVRETVSSHVLPGMAVYIVPASLKDDAPLWGAIVLAEALITG